MRSLGYTEVEIKSVKEFYHDQDRWAEFIVFITMNVDEEHPIGSDILKKMVRRWKAVGAKDNYFMIYATDITTMSATFQLRTVAYKRFISYFSYFMLDGMRNLNGSGKLDVVQNGYSIREDYNLTVQNANGGYVVKVYEKHNLHFLDGSCSLDGEKVLDAYERMEVM